MIYKNPIFSLWLFLFILALTSCGSKKRVALPADFKGPKELSRLYGVRITAEDNIFLYNEGAKWLGALTGWAEALKGEWIAPVRCHHVP